MARAVYPGSFDPVTNGHLDLIARGSRLFDELRVLVAVNSRKEPLFTVDERVAMVTEQVESFPSVSVDRAEGLTVDYCRKHGFDTILRGIRTTSDFEHEYQMALTNRSLADEIEAVFVMPSLQWSFLSSTLIREVVRSGGDVGRFVPPSVAKALAKRLG